MFFMKLPNTPSDFCVKCLKTNPMKSVLHRIA